ncbi:hypothetical protein HPB49_003422 [Dermacentor silvarum]|uniref:Uncharacterized protein n=1 Tax=Dermacentor silvarum TaxID=543639 RepID=A0ACB8DAU2_DERSI|nr:hypothetical protein HPB49_003422 [Dermacentor silvarum]
MQSRSKNAAEQPRGRRYSDEMKKFASTVHYYSLRAYEYLSTLFPMPSVQAIMKWLKVVQGRPRFSAEVLEDMKVQHKNDAPRKRLCSIVLDGMSIKKTCEQDSATGRLIDFVDLGHSREPTDAGEVLKNLLTEEIHCISEYGQEVVCDCLAVNVSMAKLLGCVLHERSFEALKTFFPHPSNEEDTIMIFDACHCLKLMRNLLGDKGVMKVKLAAQTFSSSTSKALEFASLLKLPGYGNCMGTANFIAMVDR